MKVKTYPSRLLYKASMQLGEGALWDPVSNSFLVVDILGKIINRIDIGGALVDCFPTERYVGTVVIDNQNNLITAQQGKITQINPSTREEKILRQIEPEIPTNRCNDGKCDPAGRLWFGTMDLHARPGKGNLYSFDGKNLILRVAGTSISNGICWSKDKTIMYYADTALHSVDAFDYDIETGNIINRRMVISIPEGEGSPDGMVIDSDDKLWIALWGGNCVKRYDPATGRTLAVVSVIAPQVSSCALGGTDGNLLLITTARDGMSDAELEKCPLSGSLFLAEVGAKQAAIYKFKDNNY